MKTIVEPEQRFFLRALCNAQFARGTTHPNPSVGAVIVKDGQIISEGYTHPPGGAHAEVHALNNCHGSAKGATLFVTLEPCVHFGRTPPCTDAIIAAGITRVVYGAIDPNPKVAGQGIAALKRAGIIVEPIEQPLLRAMADALLAPFAALVTHKRPYVVVKIATSADGYFAKNLGAPTKITCAEADEFVHAVRRSSDAMLVGGSTARADNPRLTARLSVPGHGQQPATIIVSISGDVPRDLHLMRRDTESSFLVVPADLKLDPQQNTTLVAAKRSSEGIDLSDAFTELAKRGFTLITIEAGPRLFAHLLKQRLADEIIWLRSPAILQARVRISCSYAKNSFVLRIAVAKLAWCG